jgi:hypothetical protein
MRFTTGGELAKLGYAYSRLAERVGADWLVGDPWKSSSGSPSRAQYSENPRERTPRSCNGRFADRRFCR